MQGRALVASPYLTDPNFLRSVVYILRHDHEGAIGLILNRPTRTSIGKLLGDLVEQEVHNDSPIYYGGPVGGPLMMLVEHAGSGEEPTAIAIASDQETIVKVCTDSIGPRYRVFDGYSGWGAEQLADELKSGGWLTWDMPPEQVFDDSEELWQRAVQEIGRDILSEQIDPSKIPDDPAFN